MRTGFGLGVKHGLVRRLDRCASYSAAGVARKDSGPKDVHRRRTGGGSRGDRGAEMTSADERGEIEVAMDEEGGEKEERRPTRRMRECETRTGKAELI